MPSIRIAQITDTHLMPNPEDRLHGIIPERTLTAVLDRLKAWRADIVIATGDLAENGDLASYQRLWSHLEDLAVPVHVIPGNHDDVQRMRLSLRGTAIQWRAAQDVGCWSLMFLDSSVPGMSGGRLDAEQLDDLRHALARRADRPKLVFVHHPPMTVGNSWLDAMGLERPQQLLDTLENSGTRAVACGHVHQVCERWNSTPVLLSAPATASQARPHVNGFVDDDLGPGFRWFELHEDGGFDTGIIRDPRSAIDISSSPVVVAST